MVLALRNEKAGVAWDKLLAQDVAIVLGGAGSGKTAEIMNQAAKLREAGVAAFVIRLEALCRQPLTQSFVLEDNSAEIFKEWQRQGGEAVAFLDALDEARLPDARNASVLQDAMARLSEGIGKFGQFLSLVITTRPSEWHGQSDLDIVKSAVTQMRTSAKTRSPDIKPKVFRLAALDIEDCQAIATSRGADAGKFIEEVNRSLSADLLSQPLDIHFLLDVWNGEIADGRKPEFIFSSKLEVYEKVISVRLRAENEQERRSNIDPIAARYACEKLAAAALLANRRDFRADNLDPDAVDATITLATNTERWSEVEVRQLLSCGLFHPSVGGRVRFAHRQIEDYLSACFFNRAIDKNAGSLDVVEPLLATGFGPKQIPQSTEQVIGWLATINQPVRRLVISLRPALMIESGDPTKLTFEEKANALKSHVSLYEERRYRGEWFQHDDVKKFAAPALAPAISKLLPTAKSPEVREFLIRAARLGRMKSLAGELAAIAANTKEPLIIRTEACLALSEFENNTFEQELIQSAFASKAPEETDLYGASPWNSFLIVFLSYAYPNYATKLDAIAILARLAREPRNYSSTTSQYVLEFIEKQADHANWLSILLRFAANGRSVDHYLLPNTIENYRVFAPAICRLTIQLIQTNLNDINASRVLDGLEYLCRIDDIVGIIKWRTPFAELANSLRSKSTLKTAFIDRRVELFGSSDNFHGVAWRSINPIEFGRDQLVLPIFNIDDVKFYCDKMRTVLDDRQKSLVFEIASQLCQKINDLEERTRAYALLNKSSRRWGNVYSQRRSSHGLAHRLRRFQYRFQHIYRHKIERKLKRAPDWVMDQYWRVRNVFSFWCNRDDIKQAIDLNKLLWIVMRAPHDRGDQTIDWINKRYGNAVANWFSIGYKNFWRKHILTEEEQNTYIASVGLVGLNLEACQGSIVCNKEEAENAFRFSFCNLNGFPDWLPNLMRDHKAEFGSLSDKFVAAIWNTGHAQGEFPTESLSKIAYSSTEIRNLVAPPLFERLKLGKPSKIPDFEIVAGIVSKSDSVVKSDLLPVLLDGFRTSTSQFEIQVAWIWLDGLFNLDASVAWTALTEFVGDTWQGSAASLWMSYIGRDPRSFSKAEERQMERSDLSSNAHVLGRLVRASYIAFPPDNDPHHEDVYSPDQKDRAADHRRYYLNTLGQIGSSEALAVLDQLSRDDSLRTHKDAFLYERDKLVRNSARRPTLDVSAAVSWLNTFTKSPSSVVEFRNMVLRHLKALLFQLKNSDDDEGYFFRRCVATEDDLRNWLSARLREVGRAWYEVIREQEVAVDKRPDLRVHARQPEFGNISIEIKLADKGWTGDDLVDKIRTQLVDQYMHEYGSHTGIYLVVNAASPKKKLLNKDGKVERPAFSKKVGGKKVNFAELVIALETRAAEVSGSLDANKIVVVEAIDLMFS
jgi:hypothetical protein